MKKFVYLLAFFISLQIILTGCSSITLPGENGEETTIDFGGMEDGNLDVSVTDSNGEESGISFEADEEGNASFTTTDGENEFVSQAGENVSLPEGFPEDFPFPDGYKLVGVQTLTENGKKAHSVQFVFTQDINSTYELYKKYAEDNGYKITQELIMEGQHSLHAGVEDGETGFSIMLMTDDTEQIGNVMVTAPQE